MSIIILSIGSNLGNRLANLQSALSAIRGVKGIEVKEISTVYVSNSCALMYDMDAKSMSNSAGDSFYNVALRCETSLSMKEVLFPLRAIERKLKGDHGRYLGLTTLTIDVLAYERQLVHPELTEQPFYIWPFADVANDFLLDEPADIIGEKFGSRSSKENRTQTEKTLWRIDIKPDSGIESTASAYLLCLSMTVLSIFGRSAGHTAGALRANFLMDTFQAACANLTSLNATTADAAKEVCVAALRKRFISQTTGVSTTASLALGLAVGCALVARRFLMPMVHVTSLHQAVYDKPNALLRRVVYQHNRYYPESDAPVTPPQNIDNAPNWRSMFFNLRRRILQRPANHPAAADASVREIEMGELRRNNSDDDILERVVERPVSP